MSITIAAITIDRGRNGEENRVASRAKESAMATSMFDHHDECRRRSSAEHLDRVPLAKRRSSQRIRYVCWLAALTLAEPDSHDLYLSRIAVEPAARGRGYGSFLLRWVAEEGRARGLARIVLEVSPASPGSEGFYRANGFVELARKAVEDSETKRRLEYVHLGKELKPK